MATQDHGRQRGLVPEDKATRVCNFQQNTLKALRDLLMAAGVDRADCIKSLLHKGLSADQLAQVA